MLGMRRETYEREREISKREKNAASFSISISLYYSTGKQAASPMHAYLNSVRVGSLAAIRGRYGRSLFMPMAAQIAAVAAASMSRSKLKRRLGKGAWKKREIL